MRKSLRIDPGRGAESAAEDSNPELGISPLLHPFTCLAAVSLALTGLFHRVFYHFAERIWATGQNVPVEDLTTWVRPAVSDRDGSEAQVLLLLTVALIVLTALAMTLIGRLPVQPRRFLVAGFLAVAALFAWRHPPRLPMAMTDPAWRHVLAVEAVILLLAVGLRWAAGRRGVHVAVALFLVPVSFLAISVPSYTDLSCILAPALRLRDSFSPSEIYFQYDFLMPLLAVGWHRLGGEAYAFSFVTQVTFYLLLLGCFLLARRLFQDPRLAGSLLVALCIVRVYAIMFDVNVTPQVTPLRTDLWIVLLIPALLFGLRHWTVGMAAAIVYFFGRSFGTLYLGSYGLAVLADFLARRTAEGKGPPRWRDVAHLVRELAPSLLWIASGLLASRLVFGAVVSDAMVMYMRLGVFTMKTATDSFYWWIAPMLAATGWLAFALYGRLPQKHAGAALLAVGLSIGNLIYFFGRSHEHNLLNISAVLLLCAFLGIDLSCFAWRDGPRWLRWTLHAAPWLVLACTAFLYAGRLTDKVHAQAARLLRNAPLTHLHDPSIINCAEISAVAKDRRVFVFGAFDYWVYEQCGYVPPGYFHPLLLLPLRSKLIEEANQLLDAGYKIVVRREDDTSPSPDPGTDAIVRKIDDINYYEFDFADIKADLGQTELTRTQDYHIYSRKR